MEINPAESQCLYETRQPNDCVMKDAVLKNKSNFNLTTLNPSKSIPLYWKILADSGYLHIEHVADFDGFRISIVFNCLVMLVDGL